ncbi:MAG: DUF4395 domain-containing protein [Nigerium sp.]|nr:DUF4395 domain-containing protein [Nigerium sp.]
MTDASSLTTSSRNAGFAQVDPRAPRFGAGITAVLLAAIIVLGPTSPVGLALLVVQTLAFAAGSLIGLQAQPWGIVYRTFVRPRLGPPAELEDARPPRFAQTVGLVFALAGLAGFVFSLPVLFFIAVAFALVAALLNAIFDFCLGCEVYLLGKRLFGARAARAAS